VDHSMVRDPEGYFEPLVNVGEHVVRSGERVRDSVGDLVDAGRALIDDGINPIEDYQNATDFRQVTLEFQRDNPELAAVLNNTEKKGSIAYQEALSQYNNYVQGQMGSRLLETNLYNSNHMTAAEKVAENGERRDGMGMTDMENGNIYINTAETNMSDTHELIGVAGHENVHAAGERNEDIADRGREQAQNAWSRENSYNENTVGGGYLGEQEWYNENYESGVIAEGTQQASGVRDVKGYQPAFELRDHEPYDERAVYYNDYLRGNTSVPLVLEEAVLSDWRRIDENVFHTWDGENTVKYLAPDGHKEAIYNVETRKPTINPKNRATYNLYDPEKYFGIPHALTDMRLYYLYGTGSDDPTSELDRVKRTMKAFE